LLAPTNAAFAKLPAGVVEFQRAEAGRSWFSLHLSRFPGIIVSSELIDGSNIRTLQASASMSVLTPSCLTMPEQSKWTSVNNGVIHKIDTVLKLVVKIKDGKGKGKGNGKSMEMGQGAGQGRHGYGYGHWKEREKGQVNGHGKGKGKGVSEDTVADFIPKIPIYPPDCCLPGRSRRCLDVPGPLLCSPQTMARRSYPRRYLGHLLNNDEFIPHLTNLLLYHVTTGELFARNFKDDMILTALNGRPPSTRPPLPSTDKDRRCRQRCFERRRPHHQRCLG
jgi:hypothetical protein